MFLTCVNWQTFDCILRSVYVPEDKSIMGASLRLPPLDIVLGDILSLPADIFFENNQNLLMIEDPIYTQIYSASQYSNRFDESAPDVISVVKEFIFACEETPSLFTLANFEIFLAACKYREPTAKKELVVKGFWGASLEKKEDINGFFQVINSLARGDFFSRYSEFKKNIDLSCTFEVYNLSDIALVALYLILRADQLLSRCSFCGRLFSPSRKGELYCTRTAPGEQFKTCKERAKYQKQIEREHASESKRVYKSIRTMLYAAYTKAKESGSDNAESLWKQLNEFTETAQEFRDNIKKSTRQGLSAEMELKYMEFLKSYYKRKK